MAFERMVSHSLAQCPRVGLEHFFMVVLNSVVFWFWLLQNTSLNGKSNTKTKFCFLWEGGQIPSYLSVRFLGWLKINIGQINRRKKTNCIYSCFWEICADIRIPESAEWRRDPELRKVGAMGFKESEPHSEGEFTW